jgi:Family of unknown function (DUF5693)
MKHLAWGGAIFVGVLGIYLMRSGNFPLIPVLTQERALRDAMDLFMGARPRFKEFLFAHPLFVLGLYMRSQQPKVSTFFSDGRLFLWIGLIGQISIVNTFLHFHTPLTESLLRSVHGIWLGILFAIPLCYGSTRWNR